MNQNLIERENKSIFQTYKRLPIVIDHAIGSKIYDAEGNEYLDMLGGIAVNNLGHCHPAINNAIKNQIDKYLHVSNFFYQEPQIKLAEKLICLSPDMSKVFFCNSGSEATEGSLKLARKWGHNKGKTEFITFSGGFHGRTYGALSMMDKPLYKEGMGPYLDGFKVVEYNNSQALIEAVNDNTVALSIEYLQGEGGLLQVSKEFCETIELLRQKFDFLLIADEIQSGLGRTGEFYAYQHYKITPDIITIAKGLGGGLPLGAFLASDKLEGVWDKGMHGTTFGGNAVSCTAGYAMIEEYSTNYSDLVRQNSEYLKNSLISVQNSFSDLVNEFRGLGYMCGLHLKFEAAFLVQKLLKKRVIANATSVNVLRLVPPFVLTTQDIDLFILRLKESLLEIRNDR